MTTGLRASDTVGIQNFLRFIISSEHYIVQLGEIQHFYLRRKNKKKYSTAF